MRRLLLIVVLVLSATATPAFATVNFSDVEDEVMCVTCNVPLNVAEGSPQADQERSTIRKLIAQGKSKDEIKDALVAQYGDRVLALPSDNGFGIAVYIVPIAVALALLALVAVLLPKWRGRGGGPGGPAVPQLSTAESQRLQSELDRYDP